MKQSFRKIISFIVALSIAFSFVTPLSMPYAYAAEDDSVSNSNSSQDTTMPTASSTCRYFLGMVSWDCGTNFTGNNTIDNTDQLSSGIWQIAANVASDITIIAAYLVLGYVIYGGYLYTFSGGDPGKVATGKKTLSQAFIGLAIVLLAYVIMNSIRIALLGASGTFNCRPSDGTNCIYTDATDVITNAINWVIAIAGVVSAIFVVYGGISYATSTGDPGKLKKAKDMITYALIGLAVVALSEIIVAFITNIINNAK